MKRPAQDIEVPHEFPTGGGSLNWRALALCPLLLAACGDLGTGPGVTPYPRPGLPGVRNGEELVSDPPVQWPVIIRSVDAGIEDPSNATRATFTTIHLFGSMVYDGYHASISASASVRESTGSVVQRVFAPQYQHVSGMAFRYNNFSAQPFPVLVQSACGAAVDADVTFRAWWQGVNLEGTIYAFDQEEENRTVQTQFPPCQPCPSSGSGGGTGGGSEIAYVVDPEYDPYASGGSDCTDNNGNGGGGSGTGTQYSPGDFTGGETVDWTTGTGNGGKSICGTEAVVEYVCIDYWDGNKWISWSCGYATAC